MPLTVSLVLELVLVVTGAIGLGVFLARQLPQRGSTWWAGGLAFVASQALRLPLLAALAASLPLAGIGPAQAAYVPLLMAAQLVSSGVFEEGARFVVLRWVFKRIRDWKGAIMFGAGHGGTEACLLVGLGIVNAVILLAGGDALVEQTRAVAPGQADALAQQIAALAATPWWVPALAVYERVCAVLLHIGLTILVMKAIGGTGGRWAWLWWLAAVVFHSGANAVVVAIHQAAGPLAAEGALTVIAAGAVLILRWARSRAPEPLANSA